jgi:hypothetical protein
VDVDAQIAFDAALDSSLFAGLTAVTRALHVCRGNAPGGRWHSTGGYGAISDQLFPRLEVDRLLLEYDTERAGAFGPLADMPSGVVAVLGLSHFVVDEELDLRILDALLGGDHSFLASLSGEVLRSGTSELRS